MAGLSVERSSITYVLTLDEEEAGYLLDLLTAHVGGVLSLNTEPLGRIRTAMKGVTYLAAYNANRSGETPYAQLYRNEGDSETL